VNNASKAVPAGEGGNGGRIIVFDDDKKSLLHAILLLGIVRAVNFNSPGQVCYCRPTVAAVKSEVNAKEAGGQTSIAL